MERAQLKPNFAGRTARPPSRAGSYFRTAVLLTALIVMPLSCNMPALLAQETKTGQTAQDTTKAGRKALYRTWQDVIDRYNIREPKTENKVAEETKKTGSGTTTYKTWQDVIDRYEIREPKTEQPAKTPVEHETFHPRKKRVEKPQNNEGASVQVLETDQELVGRALNIMFNYRRSYGPEQDERLITALETIQNSGEARKLLATELEFYSIFNNYFPTVDKQGARFYVKDMGVRMGYWGWRCTRLWDAMTDAESKYVLFSNIPTSFERMKLLQELNRYLRDELRSDVRLNESCFKYIQFTKLRNFGAETGLEDGLAIAVLKQLQMKGIIRSDWPADGVGIDLSLCYNSEPKPGGLLTYLNNVKEKVVGLRQHLDELIILGILIFIFTRKGAANIHLWK